ncbi:MAG: hypothetical protein Q9M19_01085, partial [Mariprofundaceae bacterium]|nr:hypothetical protein [Mariprofundaceae bacterium]
MSDKDDGLDDMDLGDDFDLDDMDFDMDMGIDPTGGSDGPRSPASGIISDTGRNFTDAFVDDKLGTMLDVGKAAIPKSLSAETDVLANSYGTIKEEITKQGASLRREAKNSLSAFKRFLPENGEGVANKVLSKVSGWLGDDETTSSSSGPSQAERIASEMNNMMGVKQEADIIAAQFKEQLEFTRHKDVKDIQINEAVNIERIRKFLFEVSDTYYRASLDVNLRQLYAAEELLAVTKSGFDVFKASLSAIVKNTGLPEAVKINTSELAGQQLKAKLIEAVSTSAFKDGTPIDRITSKITGIASDYGSKATEALAGLSANMESGSSLAEQGIGAGDIAAMLAADYVKTKAGKLIANQIEKSEGGKDNVRKIRNAVADPMAYLKTLSKEDGITSGLAGLLTSMAGSERNGFTVDREDPNSASYIDVRTKDSINKVIPQLLSKIYGEVKTSREIQTRLVSTDGNLTTLGIVSPEDNELVYDYTKSELITKDGLNDALTRETSRGIKTGVSDNANRVISAILGDKVSDFNRDEIKTIRDALIKVVFSKGHTSDDLFTTKSFKGLLSDSPDDLTGRFATAYKAYIRKTKADGEIHTSVNASIKNIKTSRTRHEAVARDLVDRGLTNEAIDAKLIKRLDNGRLVSDHEGITDDIVSQATSFEVDVSVPEVVTPLRDEFKGLTIKEKGALLLSKAKGKLNKDLTKEEEDPSKEGSYSDGGYTKDGNKLEEAGVVHRGEYVLNQNKLDKLLDHVDDGNVAELTKEVSDIAKDVSKQSGKYDISTDKLIAELSRLGGTTLDKSKELTNASIAAFRDKDLKHFDLDADYTDRYNTAKAGVKTMANNATESVKGTIKGMFSDKDKETIDDMIAGIRASESLVDKTKSLFSSESFKSITSVISNTLSSGVAKISEYIPENLKESGAARLAELSKAAKVASAYGVAKISEYIPENLKESGAASLAALPKTAKEAKEAIAAKAKDYADSSETLVDMVKLAKDAGIGKVEDLVDKAKGATVRTTAKLRDSVVDDKAGAIGSRLLSNGKDTKEYKQL